jgi:hypothetical protein
MELSASTVVSGASVSTSSRCTVTASKLSPLPAYMGCSRPAAVRRMARPNPISRPFGLRRTVPPADTIRSCRPQQLPNIGVPLSSSARTRSIWRWISGPPS